MNRVNENKQIVSHILPISVLLIAIYSVLPHLKTGIPMIHSLNNTMVWWIFSFLILFVFFLSKIYFFDKRNEGNMLIVWLFLLWNLVSIIRGMFVAEIYWDWKGLINNAMALLLPIVIFSATNKMIVQSLLSFFIKYALPLFIVVALIIRTDAFGFYLMPISILLLFLPALPRRQKIFLLLITLFVIGVDLGARSNVIKFGVPLLLLVIYFLKDKITVKWIEGVRLFLFIIPIVFFVLGVTDIFNVFKMDEYLESDYSAVGVDLEGNRTEVSVTADTRTFLYEEVLGSAINNNYWLLGRTPARGNDSNSFGIEIFELTGRYERLENEIGLANVFTWTGIIGVILYFLLFFNSSYLAVNKSKNVFVKILGLYVAFRWLYSWIEDVNNFNLNYFMLMIMMGLCYSESFRSMTNKDIVIWARGIFDMRYIRLQQNLLKKNKYANKKYGSFANLPQQEG